MPIDRVEGQGLPVSLHFPLIMGVLITLAGGVTFAGWPLDIPLMATWGTGAIAVQPNTGLAIAALGIGLICLASRAKVSGVMAAAIAVGIGALTLVQHATGLDIGIDQPLLFSREWGSAATSVPGRPGLPASTSFVLLGGAMILATIGKVPQRRLASAMAVACCFLCFLSLNGYLVGADRLYAMPRLTSIALPTSIMLIATSIGVLTLLPDRSPVRVLRSKGPAGALARRALPLVVLIPVLVGFLRLAGEEAGLFEVRFGTALRNVTEVAALVALLWWATRLLRRHHKALVESEELNRRIIESTRDGVKVLDLDGRLLSINPRGQTLFGIDDPAPILERPYEELWPDDQRPPIRRLLAAARAGEAGAHVALLATNPDEPRWWEVSVTPILGADTRPERLLVISRDVTERRKEEEARAALVAIVTTSEDAIVSKSLEGIIRSWNAGAERLFGWLAEEAIGKSIELIIPPEYRAEEKLILERLRRGDRIAHFEAVRVTKTGKRIDLSLSISPIKDDSGRIIGASKVARDITEKKRVEAELRLHRERLEHLVQERTAELEASHQMLRAAERMASLGTLSAGLGHDMGNLLIPIRVRLDSLAHSGLSPKAMEDVEAIRTCSEYLRRLASGLRLLALDPARSTSTETTPIAAWWQDVQGVMGSVLPRGIVLEASIEPCTDAAPAHARIPKSALTQAVFNLVQNAGDAMRDRQTGRVMVSASCPPAGPIVITVRDDGPGMTEEVRLRCMEPYFTTKTRGISTGMGLSLVSGLIREAGGSVDVQSTPGAGTTFTLTIPRAHHNSEPKAQAPRPPASVQVDDPRIRSIIARELECSGFDVHSPHGSVPSLAVVENLASASDLPSETRIVLLQPSPSSPVPDRENLVVIVGRVTIVGVRQALRRLLNPDASLSAATTASTSEGGA